MNGSGAADRAPDRARDKAADRPSHTAAHRAARPGGADGDRDRPLLVTLRALGLGDLLTAVPALRALRRHFADHRHVLLAPEELHPIVRASGAVDELVPFRALEPGLGGRGAPPGLERPAVAVNLHGSGPQSHRLLLELAPRRLLAFAHPDVAAPVEGPPWPPDAHEVWRWCGLLAEAGIAVDPTDLDLPTPDPAAVTAARAAAGTDAGRPLTVIHPGASSGARRWPVERFAAVAWAEHASGRAVAVTGSADEGELVAAVVEQGSLPPPSNRCGTPLEELMALVAGADRLVCGDTGVAHLATAYGTPSVVLFGPTPPSRWGPPPDRPRHRVLWAGMTGDPHGTNPDPGLLAIGVADVLAGLASLDAELVRAPASAPA